MLTVLDLSFQGHYCLEVSVTLVLLPWATLRSSVYPGLGCAPLFSVTWCIIFFGGKMKVPVYKVLLIDYFMPFVLFTSYLPVTF